MLAACLQELDPDAALDPGAAGASDDASGDASTWQTCGSPSCDEPNGTIPFLAQSPAIYLPNGSTTNDPCVDVEAASLAIRQTYCAGCHGPDAGAGQGGFDFVLDDARLLASPTTSPTYPSFVVPGDPYHSYLYVSVASGLMPAASAPGTAPSPIPTASDVSVLYGWIQACFPGSGGYVTGGGDYGPGADAASDAGPEASTDAGAAE
jgi:hypothetical protein